LLTHDAPAGSQVPGLSDGWPPAALEHANTHRERLQESVQAIGPKLVVHGHLHTRYTNRLASGTVVEGLDCDGTTYSKNVLVLDLLSLDAPTIVFERRRVETAMPSDLGRYALRGAVSDQTKGHLLGESISRVLGCVAELR